MNTERIEPGAEEGSGDSRSCLGQLGDDGVQDTLPRSMAPWRIQYLKSKACEKTAGVGRSLSLPPLTLRQVLNPSCEGPLRGTELWPPAAAPFGSARHNLQLRRQ